MTTTHEVISTYVEVKERKTTRTCDLCHKVITSHYYTCFRGRVFDKTENYDMHDKCYNTVLRKAIKEANTKEGQS